MVKYSVLILVLCSLEALASPSANYVGSVSDGCGGEAQLARSTNSAPAPPSSVIVIEEFVSRALERAVTAAVTQTDKDGPTTPLLGSREDIVSIVRAVVEQAMKDLTSPSTTPPTCTREIERAVAPLQQTVMNLTMSLDELTKAVLAPPSTTTSAPPSATSCDERVLRAVAPYQLTVQNLTWTVAELTRSIAQPAAPTTTPAPSLCRTDGGYERSNVTGHCYKLHQERVRWSVANDTCRGEGALLAVVNDREEARLLGAIRKTAIDACFIGVFRDSAGRWQTLSGEDVVAAAGHSVWREGEHATGEDIRYAFIGYSDVGELGATTANHSLPFICERAA